MNGSPPLRVAQVVNRDLVQPVRPFVDVARSQVETARRDLVYDLLAEREGGLGAADVRLQRAEPVISCRKHLIVEPDHQEGNAQCRPEDGSQYPEVPDTACLERRDFIFRREPAECVQGRNQHRHGESHGDDEGHGQHKELADD